MPVISVDPEELKKLSDSDDFELIKNLPKLGIEIDEIGDDEWSLEVFPDRCDMLSVEGISRAVKGFLGKDTGLIKYDTKRSDIETSVELSVQDVRPYIVTAVIKEVELNDRLLKSLMNIQEKLHLTLGRNRAKVAIGVHDLSKVKPPFVYKAVKPEDISFVPLQKNHEMTLRDILDKHEKGQKFAYILEDKEKYPIILDSEDNVLSFPPIINGVLTQVTPEAEELFIDMTGTDLRALEYSLNILCTLFADRNAEIFSTKVMYGESQEIYPRIENEKMDIDPKEVRKQLGVKIDREEITDVLGRMRYGIEDDQGEETEKIAVVVPAYRHDILHPWDVIEDIAIGYDFDNFNGEMPNEVTIGKELSIRELESTLSEMMIGYGFQEVMNYPLGNEKREYTMMRNEVQDDVYTLENPVTQEETCLRVSLLPSLMNNLHRSRNKPLPQKLFEIGDVVNDGEQRTYFSGVIIHSEAGFSEIKSHIAGMMKNVGVEHTIEENNDERFIRGRCATIKMGDDEIGLFGEIHPELLSNFELENPVTAFEIVDLTRFSREESNL
ncbi:MAG: phenylalanine--tRNA ligase subunit beta [Thermoplasmata archaeon]